MIVGDYIMLTFILKFLNLAQLRSAISAQFSQPKQNCVDS